MKAWIKNKLVNLKRTAGVKLKFLPDGGQSFTLCILEHKKGVITIVDQKEKISSIKVLASILNEIPVFLLIEGKGVLHKTVEEGQDLSNDKLLRKVLPNANLEDFYLQKIVRNQTCFVSVARRKVIDDLIEDFKAIKISLTNISLGPFILECLSSILNLENGSLTTEEHVLFFESYKSSGFEEAVLDKMNNESYKIGDDIVESAILPSYAAALSFFVDDRSDEQIVLTSKVSLKEEWEQKKIFTNSSKLILAIVFIILIINTIFFFHLNKINLQLTSYYSVHSSALNKLNALSNEVVEQEIFLEKIGWKKKSKVSFYADRLAATLPEEINWTDLQIYPMDENLFKKQKEQIFQNDLIFIKGKCKGPMILNNWLLKLEKLEWIIEINNQTYNFNEREETGVFSFNITTQ